MLQKIRLLILIVILGAGAQSAFAQIKIGDNQGNLDPNAVLEIETTNKGLLLPRITTAARLAMPSVAAGMTVYDTDAKCTYIYREGTGWYSLCSADSLTTSNGISLFGRDVQLGGTLTKATTVTTNGGNNLTISGDGTNNPLKVTNLQGGDQNDSIVTVTAATGVVRKRAVSDLLKSSNVDTLVWKIDGNTVDRLRTIGTKNAFDFPIITNNVERMKVTAAGLVTIGTATADVNSTVTIAPNGGATNPLTLQGLKGGAATDSILTADANGVVRNRDVKAVVAAGVEVENGLSKSNNKIRLGGSLNQPTVLATDATNTLALTGLQSGSGTDSVVMADPTSGVLKRISPKTLGAAAFTADNGLTKTGSNVQLGGTLLQNTAIAQAGKDLNFSGGSIAIGTASAPKSTLDITGTLAVPIVTKSSTYAIATTDPFYTVIADCTTGGFTLSLPDPTTCVGRTYILIKADPSTNVLSFGAYPINLSTTASITSINYNVRLHVQSDGTKWWLVARF